jgi:hypothetical protein
MAPTTGSHVLLDRAEVFATNKIKIDKRRADQAYAAAVELEAVLFETFNENKRALRAEAEEADRRAKEAEAVAARFEKAKIARSNALSPEQRATLAADERRLSVRGKVDGALRAVEGAIAAKVVDPATILFCKDLANRAAASLASGELDEAESLAAQANEALFPPRIKGAVGVQVAGVA